MNLNDASVEYIDVNDALNRVGGNMDLYKRLLKRFLEGNQMEELRTALQEENIEEAARLAHTIKGVSANLSLIKLREITTDLEHILKESLDSSAKLAELADAYDETARIITESIG